MMRTVGMLYQNIDFLNVVLFDNHPHPSSPHHQIYLRPRCRFVGSTLPTARFFSLTPP